MPDIPHDIQFPLADFDRSQLPEDQRGLQGDAYLQAIREHLAGQFVGQGGAAEVAVTHDRVIIRWKESGKPESLAEQGANLLKKGNTEKGVATLRLALQRDPDDAAALFNLGMSLGDAGEAAEALELLQRLVTTEPAYPGAWVALGVVQGRSKQWDAAIRSFSEAVSRNPQDGFALKNLGAALSQTGQLDEARDHLKAAVVLLPSDAQAWLNLAMNLEQSGVTAEAEIAYQRVIVLDPGGNLAEKAEAARNRITQVNFRRRGGGELRPDVLTYCGDALRIFGAMPKEEVQRITMEIAMLGASGLSVTNPSIKHQLRNLPGEFSGLHLLCLEYVGFKIIDHTVDIGFDIAAEYAEACRVHDEP
jgi:tetratricopeptide (TPR) repeat protein